jgi:predicted transcriptional regulator
MKKENICKICNKKFFYYGDKTYIKKYCCRNCMYKDRSIFEKMVKTRTERNNYIQTLFTKEKIKNSMKGKNTKEHIIQYCLHCNKPFSNTFNQSQKRKYCSRECSEKKLVWNKDKSHPLYNEYIRKIKKILKKEKIKIKCLYCSKYFMIFPSAQNCRKYCSRKCYKNNLTRNGPLNPNWKDGISFIPYGLEFNRKLKQKIKERDNYICQKCNTKFKNKKHDKTFYLTIHHIDYNKLNNHEYNLICLCNKCNSRCNSNRKYWEWQWKVFMNLFNGGIHDIQWK